MTNNTQPRRRFLQQALALVPASTLAGGMAVTQTARSNDIAPAPNAAPAYEPGYFTADEWAFVNAATDHLIPSDDYGPGAIAAGVPEFIDRQMETPYGHGKLWYMQGPFQPDAAPELGYQLNLTPRDIYRHGIAACDDWCRKAHGQRYADLAPTTQQEVLRALQNGEIEFDAVPSRTFFQYLLANTKEGYLSDPGYGGNKNMVGWKMVGFPGARGDFLDWADQPNAKYPYGPVSISGDRG